MYMSNVTEYVSGFPETTELRKTSTANAFVTVSYSYEMEYEVLRSFFPTRIRDEVRKYEVTLAPYSTRFFSTASVLFVF